MTRPSFGRRPRPTVSVAYRAVLPFVRRALRWRVAAVVAWVVGGCAGVAPTAFLGYPSSGLAAAALSGLTGVALLSPVIITPMVATIVADDDLHQVAMAWHAVGVSAGRRLTARSLAAARASVGLLWIGALGGLAAGVGLALSGRDPVRIGLGGGPGPGALALGAAVLVVSWVLGALVAIASITPARAVLVLVMSLMATGLVASLIYFVPGLASAFWLTPWASLWPFDPQSFGSTQFVVAVPVGARLCSAAAWLTILAAFAARRLRASPYPTPGERGRRSQS